MRQSGSGAKSIYYGWWVLLAAGTTGFLGFGAMIPGFLVFAVPIGEELGIDPARFAFVVGAAWAVGNLAALGAGWLADQYGGRQLVLIGGLLSCAGYAAVAGVSSYWQLVLVYSGIAAIGRGIGIVPNLMTIANQWFVRRKALAMTLLNTTFAGGAALMVPLLAWCEGWLGWRVTILYTGALSGLLVVGAAAVIRSRPEDIGLLPDGGRHEAVGTGATRNRRLEPVYSDSDFTLREAVSTPAFWLMTTAVTLRIASADALVINQIPMLVWKGIPQDLAAFYLSSTFLAIIPIRIAMGLAATWIPSRWLLIGGMSAGAVGTAAFIVGSGYGAAAMFVLSIAATEGIATLGWLAVGEYFGRRSFGSLVGIMTVSFGLGSLVAPAAAGWIFAQTGTYTAALLAAAPMQLASGICYALARRPAVGSTHGRTG